jgi:hypothetical protein
MQAHLKTAQATARPKFLKELAKPTQEKIVFKKFPTLLKKIKTATHSRHAMTRQLNNDNGLQGRTTRTTNIAYEQAGLSANSIIWIFNNLLYFYQNVIANCPNAGYWFKNNDWKYWDKNGNEMNYRPSKS